MPSSDSIVAIARLFLHVREAGGQNCGQRVEAIQRWSGGVKGQSWCAYYATMVLDLAFGGNSPIPRLGACEDIYDLAKAKGWVTETPATGDLFLYVDGSDHAHHVGFVVGVSFAEVDGIAGNTSKDGISNNGDGVYEHAIRTSVFIAYPRG